MQSKTERIPVLLKLVGNLQQKDCNFLFLEECKENLLRLRDCCSNCCVDEDGIKIKADAAKIKEFRDSFTS